MEMNLFGLAVLCVSVLAAITDMRKALLVTVALIPFGAASVANLPSGMSLPVAEVSAAIMMGAFFLRQSLNGNGSATLRIDRSHLTLLFFVVYAVFSAVVLVRVFEGDIYVFSLDRSASDDDRVSLAFGSAVTALEPSAGNISQTFYLCLSVLFFFFCTQVWRTISLSFAHRCLVVAASVNVALGFVDLAGLDGALEYIRTANYRIHSTHNVGGIPRVIGGFPEPSRFGAFTCVMLAYFGAHFVATRARTSFVLALLSFAFAALSLSTTAFLGIALTMLVVLVVAFRHAIRRNTIPLAVVVTIALLVLLSMITAVDALRKTDTLLDVLDTLVLGKASSMSALERRAWALSGYESFVASWGLGIGVGSFRGSGWLSVFLGSVGIPGTLLFGYFVFSVLRGKVDPLVAPSFKVRRDWTREGGDEMNFRPPSLDLRATRMAARSRVIAHAGTVAMVASVAMALASQTTADPGLLAMFVLAAVYCAHREVVGLRINGISYRGMRPQRRARHVAVTG